MTPSSGMIRWLIPDVVESDQIIKDLMIRRVGPNLGCRHNEPSRNTERTLQIIVNPFDRQDCTNANMGGRQIVVGSDAPKKEINCLHAAHCFPSALRSHCNHRR
jgi:hypothetical protein